MQFRKILKLLIKKNLKVLTRYWKGGRDPAERVDHIVRNWPADTADRVTNKIVGSDQDAADEQNCGRSTIM